MSPLPPFEQTEEPGHELHVDVVDGGFVVTPEHGPRQQLSAELVQDRIERYALDLMIVAPEVSAGTLLAYDTMRLLQEFLKARFERTGQKSGAELTTELLGFEGQRVRAETMAGEFREFRVARAIGWMPHHVELPVDGPARRAELHYKRVYGGVPDERMVDP